MRLMWNHTEILIMTNSQFKKKQAKLFNLRRAESLAYEMDKKLFPVPKTTHRERMNTRSGRISKLTMLAGIALASSVGDINNDY
jgi:hypothetical protein